MTYRNLIASTAIAALMVSPAFAQDSTTKTQTNMQAETQVKTAEAHGGMRWLSSQLTGKPVYASAAGESDAIGEINDLVLSPEGTIDAVIIGVGGFLGIGEKDVAVKFSDLQIEPQADGEVRLVVPATKEVLTEAQAFDRNAMRAAQRGSGGSMKQTTEQAAASNRPATENQTVTQTSTEATQTAATTTNMEKDVASDSISAEKLIGLSVYDQKEERVGEVGDVILAKSGEVDAVIVDVGGFLGIGEKPVAIGFDQLQIKQVGDNDVQLMSAISKEKFEGATAYQKDEYETRRGEMRVSAE